MSQERRLKNSTRRHRKPAHLSECFLHRIIRRSIRPKVLATSAAFALPGKHCKPRSDPVTPLLGGESETQHPVWASFATGRSNSSLGAVRYSLRMGNVHAS